MCGEWEDGSGGTKTGIHVPQPPLTAPAKLFLLLNGLFSPETPMNYVNDYGIPFFPWLEDGKKKKKREEAKTEVREIPPPRFFLFLALRLSNLSCWQCGPGFCSAAM